MTTDSSISERPLLAALAGPVTLFSLIVLLTYTICRWAALWLMGGDQLGAISNKELIDLAVVGLRYDLKMIATATLGVWAPTLVVLWFPQWQQKYLTFARRLLVVATPIFVFLGFLNLGFFLYFDGPIDPRVFAMVDDDPMAIAATTLMDWRVNLLYALTVVFGVVFAKSARHSESFTSRRWADVLGGDSLKRTLAISVTISIVMVMFARGSFGVFPLSRKHSAISTNTLLNSLTMNGALQLNYAAKDRRKNAFVGKSDDVLKRSEYRTLERLQEAAGVTDWRQLIATSAAEVTTVADRRPHVLFILLEGWTSHVVLQHELPDNDLLASFATHATADTYLPYFLPYHYGTNQTIEMLLLESSTPPVSQSEGRHTNFRTNRIRPFAEAGYETIFYSGGNASWQSHSEFWPRQDFELYIGREPIERAAGVKFDDPWGTADEYLFEYLWNDLERADAGERPLFGFVLTTTNHEPVNLPDHYQPRPVQPERFGFAADDAHSALQLHGFQYAMEHFGRFLEKLKASPMADHTIVVATGDHVRRNFYNYGRYDEAFVRYGVPAYIYAPEAYSGALSHITRTTVGSHADLFPTVYELALPEVRYINFGTSLTKRTPTRFGTLINAGILFESGMYRTNQDKLQEWSDQKVGLVQDDGIAPNDLQRQIIKQEKARLALRSWLLARQHEDPKFDPLADVSTIVD